MAAGKDKRGRPIVVVTGLGVVTSLGAGKSDNWVKLTGGESGIKTITRFPTDGLKTRIAGTIDYLPPQDTAAALTESIANLAAEEAVSQSGLGPAGSFPGPLFLAVPPIEMEWPQRLEIGAKSGANKNVTYADMLRVSAKFPDYHRRFLLGSVADNLAEKFGTLGSPISLSTACASGATAIQLGVEAIRRGETRAALCIGTDGSINPEAVIRFSLLSALSISNDVPHAAAKPFSKNRDGFVMAEGAGALVLESHEAAMARGAKILGVVEGCGEMTDAFHRTRSSPDGKPIIGCIANAIADAGLMPSDIDYINAHGTSTPENDKMEYLGCATVFGDRIKSLPISSNKSMIGHTLSAAGAVEAVFTLLTLQSQRIPPTINYTVPDPAIPLDVVPNTARDAKLRHAISN
jgi:3-oxoacyl-[acyl-carrier-protein] synthase II